MSTYFIADLHLDHKNIMKFRPCAPDYVVTVEDHNQWLYEQWHSVITKYDIVWVLGDVAFSLESLIWFDTWAGRKKLVRGNHDNLKQWQYDEVFEGVYGIVRYKKHWLTHCPIHPQEMRGLKNIHGHLHDNVILKDRDWSKPSDYWDDDSMLDDRYIGVSVDQCDGVPISLDEIRER